MAGAELYVSRSGGQDGGRQLPVRLAPALRLVVWVCVACSFVYFPHSLDRFRDGRSDLNVYLEGATNPDWLYPDYVSPIFVPFRTLPPDIAFALWYACGVCAWLYIAERDLVVGLLCSYPVLLGLEAGNITPVLAVLCIWPTGALLAALVKPYLLVFVVIHAILLRIRYNRRKRIKPFDGGSEKKPPNLSVSDSHNYTPL